MWLSGNKFWVLGSIWQIGAMFIQCSHLRGGVQNVAVVLVSGTCSQCQRLVVIAAFRNVALVGMFCIPGGPAHDLWAFGPECLARCIPCLI